MTVEDATALVAGLTALVTSLITLVKLVTHLNWHTAAQQPTVVLTQPAPPKPPVL